MFSFQYVQFLLYFLGQIALASSSRTMISGCISQLAHEPSCSAGQAGADCSQPGVAGLAPGCRLDPGVKFYLLLTYFVFIFRSVPLTFSV